MHYIIIAQPRGIFRVFENFATNLFALPGAWLRLRPLEEYLYLVFIFSGPRVCVCIFVDVFRVGCARS